MSGHVLIMIVYILTVFGTFHLAARMRGPRMVMAVPLGREVTLENRGRVRRFVLTNVVAFGSATSSRRSSRAW